MLPSTASHCENVQQDTNPWLGLEKFCYFLLLAHSSMGKLIGVFPILLLTPRGSQGLEGAMVLHRGSLKHM